jgi:cyclopropane-fatty-acyl-phospholipid synthase
MMRALPNPAFDLLRSFRRRVLDQLRKRLGSDPPRLRLVFWDGDVFDLAPEPTVTIHVRSSKVIRYLLTGNMRRLGDAYASRDLDVDGCIDEILRQGLKLADQIGRIPFVARLTRPLGLIQKRHSRRQDAAAIGYHYDVSNEFYRLWLDRNMIYSCAYFRTGTEDIDTAQRQKLVHICRKLRLAPNERLLDIGCGWGGLIRFAASRYGVRGTGVTLSSEQYRYAKEQALAENLADRVEFRLQDYRDIAGPASFDKIVSVGMYEHVGLANHRLYFETVARLLKPGGIFLNQGIVSGDPDARVKGPPGGEFVDRHVFPGGELPHVSGLLRAVASSGLEPVDLEDLRPHYAQTLLLWSQRLEAHAGSAVRHAGPERFRIWRVYLPAMAHAFNQGWLSVVQVIANKPLNAGMAPRPWTREYQYPD